MGDDLDALLQQIQLEDSSRVNGITSNVGAMGGFGSGGFGGPGGFGGGVSGPGAAAMGGGGMMGPGAGMGGMMGPGSAAMGGGMMGPGVAMGGMMGPGAAMGGGMMGPGAAMGGGMMGPGAAMGGGMMGPGAAMGGMGIMGGGMGMGMGMGVMGGGMMGPGAMGGGNGSGSGIMMMGPNGQPIMVMQGPPPPGTPPGMILMQGPPGAGVPVRQSGGSGVMIGQDGSRIGGGSGIMMMGPNGQPMMVQGAPGGLAGPGGMMVQVPMPGTEVPQMLASKCNRCKQDIVGKVCTANGKPFHPECFYCTHCQIPFDEGGRFVEFQEKLYCEKDYNEAYAPKCAYCKGAIASRFVSAFGKQFHPEHFVCPGCGASLQGKAFQEHEGMPYCGGCKKSRDDQKKAADIVICAKCKLPVFGETVEIRGLYYHPSHWRCETCHCDLRGATFFEHDDKLYCDPDYRALLKSVCGACKKPVLGRPTRALGKVWHTEHFVCFHCQIPFNGGSYKERDDKAYCEVHFQQLFGKTCENCKQPILGEIINVFGKSYHPPHFKCTKCDVFLGGKYFAHLQQPLCERCFRSIPDSEKIAAEKDALKTKKEQEKARKEDAKKLKAEQKKQEEERKKKLKEMKKK